MSESESLAEAYELCRGIHAHHGRSYYLATMLLPAAQRPGIHALYAFARHVDDIVDVPLDDVPPHERLDELTAQWQQAVRGESIDQPIFRAAADTVSKYGIGAQLTDDFLAAMRMDLDPQTYQTWADLSGYTWGSACVIGLQTAQIFGTIGDRYTALQCAALLGEAFQLTNFIRDYDEDRGRGRVYLPLEEFENCGIEGGSGDSPQLRAVIAECVARNRELYAAARPGIAMLEPAARPCVQAAFSLYSGILDEVIAANYNVIGRRHRVSTARRAALLAATVPRILASRRGRAAPTRST